MRGGGVRDGMELCWAWSSGRGEVWCLELSGAWRFGAEADGLAVFREERGLRFVRDGWVGLD